MKKLVIIGGGGHSKSVLDSFFSSAVSDYYELIIVDRKENLGKEVSGIKITATDNQLEELFEDGYHYAFIAVGSIESTRMRHRLYDKVKAIGFEFINIIDKTALIASDVKIGRGVFIGKYAIVNAGTSIGDMVIINTRATVEHECFVEEFCHVSVGSILCGNVFVGQDSFVGANSTILQGENIGKNSIIAAGCLVRNSKVYLGMKSYDLH